MAENFQPPHNNTQRMSTKEEERECVGVGEAGGEGRLQALCEVCLHQRRGILEQDPAQAPQPRADHRPSAGRSKLLPLHASVP